MYTCFPGVARERSSCMSSPSLLACCAFVAAVGSSSPLHAEPALECPEAIRGASVWVSGMPSAVIVEVTTRKAPQRADLRLLVRHAAALLEYRSKLAALDADAALVSTDGIEVPPIDIAV